MPRGKKSAKQITPKQQEILSLVEAQPDMPVKEIAKLLETSEGAIYQQIKRLRDAGALPSKGSAARRKPASASTEHVVQTTPPPVRVESIEQHLARELKTTQARLDEIKARLDELIDERQALAVRRERLTAAQNQLLAEATAEKEAAPKPQNAPAVELAAASA